MDRFYIITNSDKDPKQEITRRIADYLEQHGKECRIQQARRGGGGNYHYTDPELIPDKTECIIVLGGDGTLLQAARGLLPAEALQKPLSLPDG